MKGAIVGITWHKRMFKSVWKSSLKILILVELQKLRQK